MSRITQIVCERIPDWWGCDTESMPACTGEFVAVHCQFM